MLKRRRPTCQSVRRSQVNATLTTVGRWQMRSRIPLYHAVRNERRGSTRVRPVDVRVDRERK